MTFWEPDGPVSDAQRRQWIANAERIATGLAELAHLPSFIDPPNFRVGFFCDGDLALAEAYVRSILDENVEARAVASPEYRGDGQAPADEVVLPCRPVAGDEGIVHAVLATMKASHGLEFQIVDGAGDSGNE